MKEFESMKPGRASFVRVLKTGMTITWKEYEGVLVLDQIKTDEGLEGRGFGTCALNRLQEFAQSKNLRIRLSIEANGSKHLSHTELARWYKRHGFKKKRGRNLYTWKPRSK